MQIVKSIQTRRPPDSLDVDSNFLVNEKNKDEKAMKQQWHVKKPALTDE